MKKIWCNQLMYIRTRKMSSKRLKKMDYYYQTYQVYQCSLPQRQLQYHNHPIGFVGPLWYGVVRCGHVPVVRHRYRDHCFVLCNYIQSGVTSLKGDMDNSPCAPTLYDTCEQSLLGVISNVRAEAINYVVEVAICTSRHSWFYHSISDWMKNRSK